MKPTFQFFRDIFSGEYTGMRFSDESYLDFVGVDELSDLPKQKPRVVSKNYDVLFLFDALRYDAMFQALGDEYDVEPLMTNGGRTRRWLENTWTQKHPQLTYISASPMTRPDIREFLDDDDIPLMEPKVGTLVQTTEKEYNVDLEDFGVAKPEAVVPLVDEHEPPILVHLMQPHTPFIGGVKLHAEYHIEEVNLHEGEGRFYPFVTSGLVDIELVRLAYWANFLRALDAVDTFLDTHEDMTVALTADHGELLNQDKCSHGALSYPETAVVPWVEIEI